MPLSLLSGDNCRFFFVPPGSHSFYPQFPFLEFFFFFFYLSLSENYNEPADSPRCLTQGHFIIDMAFNRPALAVNGCNECCRVPGWSPPNVEEEGRRGGERRGGALLTSVMISKLSHFLPLLVLHSCVPSPLCPPNNPQISFQNRHHSLGWSPDTQT